MAGVFVLLGKLARDAKMSVRWERLVLAVRSCANVLEGRHVTMPLANVTVARAEKDFTVKRLVRAVCMARNAVECVTVRWRNVVIQ